MMTMSAHLAAPGRIDLADRPDPSAARVAKAEADPMFARKVAKAAAQLRMMRGAKHKMLADQLADAADFAGACGVSLPVILEDRGILRRIYG